MRLIRVRGRRAGAYSDHFLDDGPLRAVRQGLPEGLEIAAWVAGAAVGVVS